MKAMSTQKKYLFHIEQFRTNCSASTVLTEADVDEYFEGLHAKEQQVPIDKRESDSTKRHRLAALSFYLNEGTGLTIDMKRYKAKPNK